MAQLTPPSKRLRLCLSYLATLTACLILIANSQTTHAYTSELLDRSVTISTSQPSVTASHNFKFDIPTSGVLGSIKFEYCDNPFINSPCISPSGLSLSSASLSSQSGQTGFTINGSSTATMVLISRSPALAAPSSVQYQFDNITNPSTINQAVYVRISTYASNDGTGAPGQNGAVIFVLASGLSVGGFVPPQLTICVGAVVALDCTTQTGDIAQLGIFSTTATRHTTTEFSVATNDVNGYNAYILGTTLTSGNNTIVAASSPQFSQTGISQFGMNLRANTVPSGGSDPLGSGTGIISADYAQPNQYKFLSGDLIVNSPTSTDFNLFTVSYIANINSSQAAGVYTTTLTYLAVADF